MGYALMGLAAGTAFGVQAMLIYMAIYVTMNVGTFAFILSMERDGQPVTEIASLNMYSRAHPGRAMAMLILLFSLAGVPPLLGFFGKLYVLRAAYEGGLVWLAVAGVLASVIGAFYYLRIVYYMYFGEEPGAMGLPDGVGRADAGGDHQHVRDREHGTSRGRDPCPLIGASVGTIPVQAVLCRARLSRGSHEKLAPWVRSARAGGS
jgi:formate hydrogenlyase subunit 3/multisubunit Na+/H+ antiporter MnhD subunit